MSKELTGENIDGGSLMDPSGEAFQAMLTAAQQKGEAALATKPDTSPGDDEKGGEQKESPSPSSTDETKAPDAEDNESDVDALKHSIRGLKAELSRVRNQRSSSEAESSDLKERLARMEGRLEELKGTSHSSSAADSIRRLDDHKLIEMDTAYEDELADARAVARLAERDGDTEGVAKANQRISQARLMRNLIKGEKDRRGDEKADTRKSANEEQTQLTSELEGLFADMYKTAPELADHESELWKAGQAEYRKLPALTKRLGPLGELIATAAAIAKNPTLLSKKATEKVLDEIERVAEKSFQKGGTAPKAGTKTDSYNLNSPADMQSFEEQVARIKRG